MANNTVLILAFIGCLALVQTEAAVPKLGFRSFRNEEFEARDLRDCVINHVSAVVALAKETLKTQSVCVEENRAEIIEIENKLIADLIVVHGDLVELVFNINQCSDRECLKENGARMLEIIGVISQLVGKAVQEGMQIVIQTSPEAGQCVQAASSNFGAEFQRLRRVFVACIRG